MRCWAGGSPWACSLLCPSWVLSALPHLGPNSQPWIPMSRAASPLFSIPFACRDATGKGPAATFPWWQRIPLLLELEFASLLLVCCPKPWLHLHTSLGLFSLPAPRQTQAHAWGMHSVGSGKPIPIPFPIDSHFGAGKPPFSSYKPLLVMASALPNHGALPFPGGTQPKQPRRSMIWDFHWSWDESPAWDRERVALGLPTALWFLNVLFIL